MTLRSDDPSLSSFGPKLTIQDDSSTKTDDPSLRLSNLTTRGPPRADESDQVMSDFSTSSFLQIEALHAIMRSDETTLAKTLMAMREQELRSFLRTLDQLREQVRAQLQLKEL
jgi:hypothetical protein